MGLFLLLSMLYNCIINSGDDMKKYLRKNIPFDPESEEEMKLYQWLQRLPHGYFSEMTKKFWKDAMKNNKLVDEHIKKMKEDKNGKSDTM